MSDELFYGGGKEMPVMNDTGVTNFFFSPDTVLSNDFVLDALLPGQLADNQDKSAVIITFKGVDAFDPKVVKAVTVVMEPEMLANIIRLGRVKYGQIPVEYR